MAWSVRELRMKKDQAMVRARAQILRLKRDVEVVDLDAPIQLPDGFPPEKAREKREHIRQSQR